MVQQIEVKNVDRRISGWKNALSDAATGPLIVASEIVAFGRDWEDYRSEAGDLDYSAWLRKHLGPGKTLKFFQERHEAVQKLGEAVRRALSHDLAVWVVKTVPAERLQEAKTALLRKYVEQKPNALTRAQGGLVIAKMLDRKPVRKQCARCERLEKLLEANGIEVLE